jgi:hypothetical protein
MAEVQDVIYESRSKFLEQIMVLHFGASTGMLQLNKTYAPLQRFSCSNSRVGNSPPAKIFIRGDSQNQTLL